MTSRFDLTGCQAAIFDMDGTLLNSMRFWRLTGLEYLTAHDLPLPPWPVERFFRTSSHSMVVSVLDSLHAEYDDAALVDELERRMAKYYRQDIAPKPHAEALLQFLQARGIPCAVATATPRAIARDALDRHGLLRYFEFVTDGYELGTGKSDPEYFLAVAKRLNAAPEACWMFEDALYAVRGAKAAGLRVCAIEDYTAASAEEIQRLADVYVRDYTELLD